MLECLPISPAKSYLTVPNKTIINDGFTMVIIILPGNRSLHIISSASKHFVFRGRLKTKHMQIETRRPSADKLIVGFRQTSRFWQLMSKLENTGQC